MDLFNYFSLEQWPLVPLYGVQGNRCECGIASCTSPGKHPRLKAWHRRPVVEPGKARRWMGARPSMNWGIILRPTGLIDVEYDTSEGEQTATELLGASLTVSWRSRRSIHRLYTLPPELHRLSLTVRAWRGLEIRTGTHWKACQSVIPPSTHYTGSRYAWLDGLSPLEVEVAVLPGELCGVLSAAG